VGGEQSPANQQPRRSPKTFLGESRSRIGAKEELISFEQRTGAEIAGAPLKDKVDRKKDASIQLTWAIEESGFGALAGLNLR